MLQKMKKMLAACCVFAMIITMMPIPVQAATPRYVKTYAHLYENGTTKGVYTFKLQNLKKGQKVKWSISGTGKAYAKLQKTSTTVTGTTATNKVTINTGGKTAVNNKRVILVAKIYSSKGKLQYTSKAIGRIRVYPKTVTLSGDALTSGVLEIGKSYQVNATITPANALYAKNWIVSNAAGEDYSDYITSDGVFTPKIPGNYTITCQAKIASKVIRTAKADVTVANTMMEVKQVAANKLQAIYASDVREQVTMDNYSIRSAAGSVILPKELSFSEDGTVATIKTSTLFKDATSYTVSDGNKSISFTASVGRPASIEILTETVTVRKETPIEYAIYDANGVDVTTAYEGTLQYNSKLTEGFLTNENKIYINKVGEGGWVEITYTNKADSSIVLTSNRKIILCKSAATSTKTNFTLTTSKKTPEYSASSYKDNVKVAIGTNYYAHFRALDDDGSEIKYDSISYECSDPETLIIAEDGSDGKVTPIKQGTVKIFVTAKYAGENYDYMYEVQVTEARYLAGLKLSTSSLTMSNVFADGYKGYIAVTGLDQSGETIALDGETFSITETSSVKSNMANYNTEKNQLEFNAYGQRENGYSFTLTLTQNGKSASANFTVVVRTPPANGALSYVVEVDQASVDLAITSDTLTDRTCKVRLARYRGGVFDGYMTMSSMTIRKGDKYYTADLTVEGGTTSTPIPVSDTYLDLTVLKIGTDNVCKKAETGSYIAEIKYINDSASQSTASGAVTLVDTQVKPEISVVRTTANELCDTAVALARNCLSVTVGDIVECKVTGDTQKGSEIVLTSRQQVNIASVTVRSSMTIGGKSISYTFEVPVGKTLKNY